MLSTFKVLKPNAITIEHGPCMKRLMCERKIVRKNPRY